MNSTHTRYPGAQPFSDDDFSRRVFFGREQASIALTDQVLANRLVVVYAKSGLGKTSLLNAGVAPRLRDEGYLPLIVRVNDVQQGALVSVLVGIRAEAKRQQVEYVPGVSDSLWTFFKTAEFWRGDLLLTPVLILDQFEELFTLQSEQQRTSFLTDLSYLVRGVRPYVSAQADVTLSESPPVLRIVLSLREDYLGSLEEAAEHIPQILDHRFRLAPLTLEAASEAMTGPAAIDDSALETKPFSYDPEAVTMIVTYLSQRRTQGVTQSTRYVEPFQLQLICQRVEHLVAQRQPQSSANLILTLVDIGGEAALEGTLRDFYVDAIRTLPKRSERRAVRRLCQNYLISPNGRRLSLEENELRRQLKLSGETLKQLVANRLLRTDNRSDTSYYELSHDALVEPVLATRRKRAMFVGWLGLIAAFFLLLLTSVLGITLLQAVTFSHEYSQDSIERSQEIFRFTLMFIGIFATFLFSLGLVRGGFRSLRRYRRRRGAEFVEPMRSSQSTRDLLLGWFSVAAGWLVFLLAIIVGGMLLFLVIGAYYTEGKPPDWWSADLHEAWQLIYENGPGLDLAVWFVTLLVMLLFAMELLRWGGRALLYYPGLRGSQVQMDEALLASRRTKAWLFGSLELIAGIIVLFAAGFWGGLLLLAVKCKYYPEGKLLVWFPTNLFTFVRYDCRSAYESGWGIDRVFNLLLLVVTSFFPYGYYIVEFGRSAAFGARTVSWDNLLSQTDSRIQSLIHP